MPGRFEDAVSFYPDRYRVRDAAARRVRGYWQLRFDERLISDLDDAIRAGRNGDEQTMRAVAARVLDAAARLGQRVFAGEIERMPGDGRSRIAALAGCASDPAALVARYRAGADAVQTDLLARLWPDGRPGSRGTLASLPGGPGAASSRKSRAAPATQTLHLLQDIRRRIEPAPDDQGRLLRQVTLAWGAIPAWIGLEAEEAKLAAKTQAKLTRTFQRARRWIPPASDDSGLLERYAPVIVVESRDHPPYPPGDDRFGQVRLVGRLPAPDVHVDPTHPVVYGYLGEAKIHGRRHRQLVYVWWFPERPELAEHDAAAGLIDGDTLRITLNSQGRPAVFEAMLNCGCGHTVFVSDRLEQAACRAFNGAEPGKQYCVEHDVANRRDLVVASTVREPSRTVAAPTSKDAAALTVPPGRPLVYVSAACHEICRIAWSQDTPSADVSVVDTQRYALMDYDALDRLPLGDGVGSMFGADGLVHNAGRPEGFLLAPTGMLSAGQPRKRGTQRIRWDAYRFDDPRLLERTLRLPDDF